MSRPPALLDHVWTCPLCGLEGQAQIGRVDQSNLAAHYAVVHPEHAPQPPTASPR